MMKTVAKYAVIALLSLLSLQIGEVFAAGEAVGIGKVSNNVKDGMESLANLITAASFVMGFGFAATAILKFKAHKDNPAQIPVGTPIALLFIAAALIYLPSMYGAIGETLFNTSATSGKATGVIDSDGTVMKPGKAT